MPISRAQSRAARGKLEWSQGDLANTAGINKRTVADWERGKRDCFPRTLQRIQQTFEAAGVQFVSGSIEGVQWRP